MADDSPALDDNSHELASDKVLIAWTKAVTDFYLCHSQLVALLDQSAVGQQTVGQCLVSNLWETSASMEAQLKRLWNDLPRTREDPLDYERIKEHTTQLNQLIHQAQRMLHLASLPDS